MRQFLTLFVLIFLILAGCNSDEQKGEKVTVSSVFNQTISNLDDVENYMMDYSLEQQVVVPEVNEPITVKQKETTYIESDPFQFITELDLNSDQVTLVYKNDQLYEQASNKKIASEPFTRLPDLINEQRHLPVLLELFQTMEDQFELNEKENSYVLTLNGKGENFKSFVKNQIETATLKGSELPISQSDLQVKEVNIEMTIDQKSKNVQSIHTSFTSEQNQTSIEQQISRSYYDYNQESKKIAEK